jgi:hypothetical protein
VWEAFKNENYEALALAFQGMTDKEVEDIEQDILQHNCKAPLLIFFFFFFFFFGFFF